jgi:hypothetical protein
MALALDAETRVEPRYRAERCSQGRLLYKRSQGDATALGGPLDVSNPLRWRLGFATCLSQELGGAANAQWSVSAADLDNAAIGFALMLSCSILSCKGVRRSGLAGNAWVTRHKVRIGHRPICSRRRRRRIARPSWNCVGLSLVSRSRRWALTSFEDNRSRLTLRWGRYSCRGMALTPVDMNRHSVRVWERRMKRVRWSSVCWWERPTGLGMARPAERGLGWRVSAAPQPTTPHARAGDRCQ